MRTLSRRSCLSAGRRDAGHDCRENQSLPDQTILPDLYHRVTVLEFQWLRLDLVPSRSSLKPISGATGPTWQRFPAKWEESDESSRQRTRGLPALQYSWPLPPYADVS